MNRRAFVLLSGGIDSTTCLYKAIVDFIPERLRFMITDRPEEWSAVEALGKIDWVEAISVDYGQRHRREMEYAAATCARLGIKHSILNIRGILDGAGVMLTDAAVAIPSISYSEIEGVSPTYVPFRNGTLLSLITAHAQKWVNQQLEADAGLRQLSKPAAAEAMRDSVGVYFGAHAEDAANWAYPDCTPEFIGAMANAIYVGSYGCIRLYTPIQWAGKAEVIRLGQSLGVDWVSTWSCLAKGTEVLTLAGKEPIEKIKAGRWVWGFDDLEQRWVPALVEAALFQGIKEVYEIQLKDGAGKYKSAFRATGDHRLMLRDGGYARVDEMEPGTRLMPASPRIGYVTRKGRGGVGYLMFKPHNIWDEPWVYMHRYVAEFFGMQMGGIIHHGKDGSLNNDPSNLVSMPLGEHTRLHMKLDRDKIWNDDVNARRAATVAKRWAEMDDDEYAARRAAISDGRQNHIVLSVKKVGDAPTYDLQTSTENFAIGAGIFVHNCYAGGDAHCGECPTCRARRAGFAAAGVPDPTVYLK